MSEPGTWMGTGPQRSEGSRLKHPLMMQTLIRKLTTELESETRHDQVRATASGIGFALAMRHVTMSILRQAQGVPFACHAGTSDCMQSEGRKCAM